MSGGRWHREHACLHPCTNMSASPFPAHDKAFVQSAALSISAQYCTRCVKQREPANTHTHTESLTRSSSAPKNLLIAPQTPCVPRVPTLRIVDVGTSTSLTPQCKARVPSGPPSSGTFAKKTEAVADSRDEANGSAAVSNMRQAQGTAVRHSRNHRTRPATAERRPTGRKQVQTSRTRPATARRQTGRKQVQTRSGHGQDDRRAHRNGGEEGGLRSGCAFRAVA